MGVKTTWVIGGDPTCDLVIDLPSVSRRHCRLSAGADGSFTVDDLGSTNGTYVNGRRIFAATPLRRSDAVTLGMLVPMPWPDVPPPPSPGTRVLRVGREPDNDFVIDSPEVSGHHARVEIEPGGRAGFVEDLGSTNGTAVGAPDRLVTRSAFTPDDVVYFGPVAVSAASFFATRDAASPDGVPEFVVRGAVMTVGRDHGCDRVVDSPVVSGRHARFVRTSQGLMVEDLGSSNGTFVNGRRVETTAMVVPGDLIGLGSHVMRLVDGPAGEVSGLDASAALPSTQSADVNAIRTVAPAAYLVTVGAGLGIQSLVLAGLIHAVGRASNTSALFGLSLASVWVGLTSAFYERLLDAWSPKARRSDGPVASDLSRSLVRAAVVAGMFSLGLLGLVPVFVATAGGWPSACAVLLLTVLVGAAMGLVMVRLAGRRAVGIPAAVGLVVLMGLLCVPLRPLPTLGPFGRLAASALPTRWAFEALCLLSAGEKVDDPAADPVEPFFPAETDRAGLPACASALLAMLAGLIYADALIALSGPGRPPPGGPGSR